MFCDTTPNAVVFVCKADSAVDRIPFSDTGGLPANPLSSVQCSQAACHGRNAGSRGNAMVSDALQPSLRGSVCRGGRTCLACVARAAGVFRTECGKMPTR